MARSIPRTLRQIALPGRTPRPTAMVLDLGTGAVTVDLRRSANAKRMTLRVPPGDANPVLTLPTRAHVSQAERFVESHRGWLAARLSERTPGQPFADGATIPFRGDPHLIRAFGGPRRVFAEEGVLAVGGPPEHVARRLQDFLRRTARADITVAVDEFATKVGRAPSAVRIKDTRAQWGSCTPGGVLSFSWRLVLAPPYVLRYVAAHEVAHLIELNHSAAFWDLNAKLDPDLERARSWLKRHGRTLHAVGAGPGPAPQEDAPSR